jgi:MFS family permease
VITGVWAGAGSAMGEDSSETGQDFSWRAFWITCRSLVVNALRSVNNMVRQKNTFTSQQNSFTWWVVNRLMFLVALTSLQRFAPYFLMSTFHISREAGTAKYGNLIMLVGVFTLVSALPAGWLSDRFGRKRLISYSGVIAAVGTAVLLVSIWIPNDLIIYAAGLIIGLGTGLFNSINWALGTDLVPKAEAGRYLGIQNLAGAGAGMIGMMVGGPMADLINAYQPGLGYFAIFGCYAILFLLSIIFLRWVKKSEAQLAISAN